MSQLIHVADDVYANLTRIKKARKASYSEVIRELLPGEKDGRTETLTDLVNWIRARDKGVKKETRIIDHDRIAYGVSRAHSR